jgi:chromosome segregation ATPase
VQTEVDLLTSAVFIDRYIAEQLNALKASVPELNSLIEKTNKQITENEEALKDKASASKDVMNNLEQLRSQNEFMAEKFDEVEGELNRLWTCCDRSFAFYDAIMASASDEKVMLAAQAMTSAALDRIGFLKQVLEPSAPNA